jgi:hypothetical protein
MSIDTTRPALHRALVAGPGANDAYRLKSSVIVISFRSSDMRDFLLSTGPQNCNLLGPMDQGE